MIRSDREWFQHNSRSYRESSPPIDLRPIGTFELLIARIAYVLPNVVFALIFTIFGVLRALRENQSWQTFSIMIGIGLAVPMILAMMIVIGTSKQGGSRVCRFAGLPKQMSAGQRSKAREAVRIYELVERDDRGLVVVGIDDEFVLSDHSLSIELEVSKSGRIAACTFHGPTGHSRHRAIGRLATSTRRASDSARGDAY